MTLIVSLQPGAAQPAARGAPEAETALPFAGLLTPLLVKAGKTGLPSAPHGVLPGKETHDGRAALPSDLSALTPEQQQAFIALLTPASDGLALAQRPGDAESTTKSGDDKEGALSGLPALISLLATFNGAHPADMTPNAATQTAADAAADDATFVSLRHLADKLPAAVPTPTTQDTPPISSTDAGAPPALAQYSAATDMERIVGATETAARLAGSEHPTNAVRMEQHAPTPLHLATPNNQPQFAAAEASAPPLLNARLGSPEWQQALGQQILLFNRNGQHQAELRLHPQELGSVQISLQINDNQAHLHLVSAHSQVRAALESALPQLRTALAESGIQLGQSSVGGGDAQSQWGQHDGARQEPALFNHDLAAGAPETLPLNATLVSRHDGSVDIAV